MKTLNDFRHDLQHAMRTLDLIQQDVERDFGVSQSIISNFLSGRRGLSGASVLKLWPLIYQPPELRSDLWPPAAPSTPSAREEAHDG